MAHVLLLPGLACDAELWRDQTPALLAAGHLVHISDAHTRHAVLPQMAQALLAQQPGAFIAVGSSMGGMLALELQRQAPERVHGLALLGSSARADTPELLKLRSDAIVLFEQGRMNEVLVPNVPLALHPQAAGHAALVADYLTMMARAGATQLTAQNRAVMARDDQRARLGGIACPVLVVCGEDDLLTPPELSREIAAAVPRSQLLLLPRCGHLLTWEQPAAVNAALLDWLARLPSAG